MKRDKGAVAKVKSKIKQYQKARLAEQRRALQTRRAAVSDTEYAGATATEEIVSIDSDKTTEKVIQERMQADLVSALAAAGVRSENESEILPESDGEDVIFQEEMPPSAEGLADDDALPVQSEDEVVPSAEDTLMPPTEEQADVVADESEMAEPAALTDEAAGEEDGTANEEANNIGQRAAKKRGKGLKYSLIALVSALVIYGALALFFQSHFYFGTKINGVDVSARSAQGAAEIIDAKAGDYVLELKERDGNIENLQGKEIDLRYEGIERLEELVAQQTYYNWAVESIRNDNKKIIPMTFDELKLQSRVDQLACLLPENTVKPTNPKFQYQDGAFVVTAGDRGKEVDKERLYIAVVTAMGAMEAQMDMDEKGCYVEPAYNLDSPETAEVKNALNRYITSQITYHIGEQTFVLDGSCISQWLSVDENYQIVIDRKSVDAYVQEMTAQYRKLKRTTSFTTTGGSRIIVNGGDYNGVINRGAEAEFLISAIQKGEPTARDLNNIGNTYVEISLSGQRLWFYKDGNLIVESSIVSGNVRRGYATPKGVYSLKYKQRNVVLKGEDYESPVSFWMPFNGIVGMHDATWRSRFGGTIYISDGSHSCINLPYNVARTIYNNIVPGTPIVCY